MDARLISSTEAMLLLLVPSITCWLGRELLVELLLLLLLSLLLVVLVMMVVVVRVVVAGAVTVAVAEADAVRVVASRNDSSDNINHNKLEESFETSEFG